MWLTALENGIRSRWSLENINLISGQTTDTYCSDFLRSSCFQNVQKPNVHLSREDIRRYDRRFRLPWSERVCVFVLPRPTERVGGQMSSYLLWYCWAVTREDALGALWGHQEHTDSSINASEHMLHHRLMTHLNTTACFGKRHFYRGCPVHCFRSDYDLFMNYDSFHSEEFLSENIFKWIQFHFCRIIYNSKSNKVFWCLMITQ